MAAHTKLSYLHQPGKEPLSNQTIGQLLEQSALKYPERLAIISKHQNQCLTFAEILKQSDEFAAGLLKLGLVKGDRLGLWAPNRIEWIITMMACARIGLILVALNPFCQAPEMEYYIQKVQMKAVVCTHKHKMQNYYEVLRKFVRELEYCLSGQLKSVKVPSLEIVIVITDEDLSGVYKYREVFKLADRKTINNIKNSQNFILMDDACNIQFTSGTTGQPKAAVLSHFNLVNNSYEVGKGNELHLKPHKICLQVPFFHVFGLNVGILSALHFGSTLVLPSESYNPEKSLDAIKDERCTCVFGTPTMFIDLITNQKKRNEDLFLEIVSWGGAPGSPHFIQQINEVLKPKTIKTLYGLTETTGPCFQSLEDENEDVLCTTVGCLKDHLEAKVINENGQIVPMGMSGELCIRGYCTFLGYWEDSGKTREIFGEDRWLKTGDQFILMENGYGKINGRYKEMIIRGGENIFPKEIEDVLNSHPDILETQVIGLPHDRLGEEVCACVRVKNSAEVTLERLMEFCSERMSRFKIPSQLKIVEEFPKTASGKIQKFVLVEKYKSNGMR